MSAETKKSDPFDVIKKWLLGDPLDGLCSLDISEVHQEEILNCCSIHSVQINK